MTSCSGGAPAVERVAYRDANVLRWLTAYTGSITGDVVYFLTLTWTAAQSAGPSQAGLVVAAGALPRAVLMLGGGVVADRFGPWRVAVLSDTARFTVLLVAAAALAVTSPGLWLLIVIALVFGTVDAMFMPAVGALPPRLTTPGQLARVQGMRGLAVRVSNALGPLLAGIVLTAGSPVAFGTAALLFAAALVLLLTLRVAPLPRPTERDSAWRDLSEGARYARRHRALAPLVTVIGLSEMCFSGPVATGLVLLSDQRGWGASGMGWIASAFSVGGAASTLLLAACPRVPRAGWLISGTLLVTAAGTAAMGFVDSLSLVTALGALIGLGSGIVSTLTAALTQTESDPRYLGRVTAVASLCTLGVAPMLLPATGFTIATWGAAAFFTGCGALCLMAAMVSLAASGVRGSGYRAVR